MLRWYPVGVSTAARRITRGSGGGRTLPVMRIPTVALAVACLAVLPLTGCAAAGGAATPASAGAASSSPGPTTTASPAASGSAADLAGTSWRVREVDGETVRLDGTSVTVTAG